VIALSLGSCEQHTKMARYRDAQAGWTISYPASMHLAQIDASHYPPGAVAKFPRHERRFWPEG